MKHYVVTLAISSIAISAPLTSSRAATVILNNGAPYDYIVHANHAGSGTSLNLHTKQIESLVVYSSSDTIDVGNGDGVAETTGVGGNGFTDITVDPVLNFSVMQFKLEGPTGNDPGHDFDILIHFVGGGTQTISDFVLPPNDKFDILAGPGEVMTSITFSGLRDAAGAAQDFHALKQVSFNAAVPEPGTWAMMLGGFVLMGAAARRRARTMAVTA
jgi:hypothetical protein